MKESFLITRLKRNWQLPSLFLIWIVTVFAKLKFNGLSFGLDYSLYQPDGKYYTFQALRFAGDTHSSAAKLVVDWYANHGLKMNFFTPDILDSSKNPSLGLTRPRILYSLLSVPFVIIFGIPGMIVVPALSLLALLFLIYKISKQNDQTILGWILIIGVTQSPTIQRWMLVNCTDSLLVGLFSIYLLFMNSKVNDKTVPYIIVIFAALTAITRFTLPIWLGLSIVLIFKNRFRLALVMSMSSLFFSLPALILQPPQGFLPGITDANLIEKSLRLPMSFIKVVFFETAELVVLDRILLCIILVALVIAISKRGISQNMNFLSVLLATLILGAINGTVGVNFRYQLPCIPFALLVLMPKKNSNLE